MRRGACHLLQKKNVEERERKKTIIAAPKVSGIRWRRRCAYFMYGSDVPRGTFSSLAHLNIRRRGGCHAVRNVFPSPPFPLSAIPNTGKKRSFLTAPQKKFLQAPAVGVITFHVFPPTEAKEKNAKRSFSKLETSSVEGNGGEHTVGGVGSNSSKSSQL